MNVVAGHDEEELSEASELSAQEELSSEEEAAGFLGAQDKEMAERIYRYYNVDAKGLDFEKGTKSTEAIRVRRQECINIYILYT